MITKERLINSYVVSENSTLVDLYKSALNRVGLLKGTWLAGYGSCDYVIHSNGETVAGGASLIVGCKQLTLADFKPDGDASGGNAKIYGYKENTLKVDLESIETGRNVGKVSKMIGMAIEHAKLAGATFSEGDTFTLNGEELTMTKESAEIYNGDKAENYRSFHCGVLTNIQNKGG